jgi:hypothetical protein
VALNRRTSVILPALIALGLVGGLPHAASAVAERHVYILWLDGTTLSDLAEPSLANFHWLLRTSSVALLSTRTQNEALDPPTLRANAAVTFGAGARAAADPVKGPLSLPAVTPGLLGDALAGAGYHTAIVGDADGMDRTDRNAALAVARTNGELPPHFLISVPLPTFPTGRASDENRLARVLSVQGPSFNVFVVDPGDTERVERAYARGVPQFAKESALRRADAALGVIRTSLREQDLLVVVSASASPVRQREGIRLGVTAIEGPGFPPGLLRSGTTRRDGVLSLTDLAPTLTSALGLELNHVEGRVATSIPRADPVPGLIGFERDIVRSSEARYVLTRGFLFLSMGVALIALLLVLVTSTETTRVRLWSREFVILLLMTTLTAPLALYCVGSFHPPSTGMAALEVAAVSAGVAISTRVLLGVRWSIVGILGLTAAVPLVDIVLGTPLGVRSPLSFQIATGARFFGVGGDVLGVVVGAELFAVGLSLVHSQVKRRHTGVIAILFGSTVWVMASPSLGSKFGAALTAIPAFLVLAMMLGGRPLSWRSSFLITLATLGGAGLFVAVDALRSPQTRAHVAPAFEGKSSLWTIVDRKIHASWSLAQHTIWLPALVVVAGALIIAMWRRRNIFASQFARHAMQRSALVAGLVGTVAGILFNDTGVITGAMIGLVGTTATFAIVLADTLPNEGGAVERVADRGAPSGDNLLIPDDH